MPTAPTLSFVVLVLSLPFTLISRPSWHAVDALTKPVSSTGEDGSRVLLLTAHPDDECMFFAPTLLGLFAHGSASVEDRNSPEIFSLCLSVGNADGLGNVRRDELGQSLDVLGVPPSRRWVEDRSDLQDNFTAQWDHDTIADVVRPYVLENRITTILTFDKYGISGHPNHVSLPHGAARMLSTFPLHSDIGSPESSATASTLARPRLFTLVSVPLAHKYTGPWAALLLKASFTVSDVRTGPAFVAGVNEYATALRAMMQHRSQLVWFRWLYVAFSRYMWVNEWVEVVPPSSPESAAPV
ncbi:LmbE-like protein [Rhodofomes roseus]|uniref:N-acetylglucosaminylphosphatidylinositol deacetylase n=1 Tax=Rhodofomes roseus TaxID=34475 RepID=A0ABQ8KGE5_9APHY|nr:LmbE-like protein [Rhodofomes roseus]KAH9836312.1 LmbE-like protein [Rhodofomes roseus]